MLSKKLVRCFAPFNDFTENQLEELMTELIEENHTQGRIVFKRGRTLADKFFLLHGDVELINSDFQSISCSARIDSLESPDLALCTLNPDATSSQSCIVKSKVAKVFRIASDTLDRIMSGDSEYDLVEPALTSHQLGPSCKTLEVEEINQQSDDWMSALLQKPLFSSVPMTKVQEMFSHLEDIEVEAGQMIVREGEAGDYFYVIAEGEAQISNRCESVNISLFAGDHFGEEALLAGISRNASVVMKRKGRLKRLCSSDFDPILKAPVLQYMEEERLEKFDKPYQLVDVKMPIEYRAHHFPNSINIPLTRLRNTLNGLNPEDTYIVAGDAGGRADIAAHLLCQAGYDAFVLRNGT